MLGTVFAALYEEARTALREGRLEVAEGGFQTLVDASPERPGGFVGLAEVAQAKKDAVLAAERWRFCLDRFPVDPPASWSSSYAWSLFSLGQFADAEALFGALSCHHSEDHRPALGVAYCTMRQGRWADAVNAWDRVLKWGPEQAEPDWLSSRAQCLVELKEFDRATEAYGALLSVHPELVSAHHAYVSLLINLDRPAEAMLAFDRVLERFPEDVGLLILGTKLALDQTNLHRAKSMLRSAAAIAGSDRLESVFNIVPALFEGWERTSLWLELDRRLEDLEAETNLADKPDSAVLAMRLRLALRDYPGFLARLDDVPADRESGWLTELRSLGGILRAPCFPDFAAEKIFGIGLSRTGTTSLTAALEMLGFRAAHWTSRFTEEILSLDDAFLFDALCDTPVCPIFETLYYLFPNSKFIYTTRPLETWLPSIIALRRRQGEPSSLDEFRLHVTMRGAARYGTERAALIGALFFHHADYPAAYRAYDRRVKEFFNAHDPNRLLELDVTSGDGWEALCGFLHRPIPEEPYPWTNRGYRSRER